MVLNNACHYVTVWLCTSDNELKCVLLTQLFCKHHKMAGVCHIINIHRSDRNDLFLTMLGVLPVCMFHKHHFYGWTVFLMFLNYGSTANVLKILLLCLEEELLFKTPLTIRSLTESAELCKPNMGINTHSAPCRCTQTYMVSEFL